MTGAILAGLVVYFGIGAFIGGLTANVWNSGDDGAVSCAALLFIVTLWPFGLCISAGVLTVRILTILGNRLWRGRG